MPYEYEINELAKEESWRMFRIIGEMVEGFDTLSGIEPAVSIYGSARLKPDDKLYAQTTEIARRLGQMGFSIITGGGPGVMEAGNKGALEAGAHVSGLGHEGKGLPACPDSVDPGGGILRFGGAPSDPDFYQGGSSKRWDSGRLADENGSGYWSICRCRAGSSPQFGHGYHRALPGPPCMG